MVSVIIPTYRRSREVIERTLNSLFSDQENLHLINEVILIDQNVPELQFSVQNEKVSVLHLDVKQATDLEQAQSRLKEKRSLPHVVHLYGLQPSVTKAKNFGSNFTTGKYFVFFDDDVTVLPGCISNYVRIFESQPEVIYLGGREILDKSLKKESSVKQFLRKLSQWKSEPDYQVNGVYVGRIKGNSFMIKNFDIETDRLVKIDGARGCNWACRQEAFFKAGKFDEHYQGSALREETDLYLRLDKIGQGFFNSKSAVIHHRQLGGCDNLSDSLKSLRSKLDNELYFQKKNFANRSRIFFAVRLLPLVIDTFVESKGFSVLLWFLYIFKV